MKRAAASKKKTGKGNDYATPALDKGLDIIELLAHKPAGLTKSQIARELDRTVSEIFRMLLCLERRGYISHVSGDEYALTLKLFKLVQEHPPTARLISEATPAMHRLANDTLQSCHMGIIDGARVTILAQVNPPTSTGFYVKLGSTVDIMEASTGYVILAHQDEQHLEQMLSEWKRETGKRVPADLDEHLARIRKRGYEERESYQVHGVTNITFPIFGEKGSAVGALTVPFIRHRNETAAQTKVVEALRICTEKITAALGGSAS